MPTVRIPVDLTWTGTSGSPGVNVWHARLDDISSVADIDEVSNMIKAFYEDLIPVFPSDYRASFAGQATGVADDAEDNWPGTPWSVDGTFGNSTYLPPHVAMYVNWSTSGGGRSGRGRTYIGPLYTSANEGNGTPAEAYRDYLQDAADALISESSGSLNGAVGVYSRSTNVFRDFVSADVPNKFASLRSRRD